MAFTIPNEGDAGNTNQAEPDSKDFEILAAGFIRTGVLSGCGVTAQGSPNMTVAVAAGRIVHQGRAATVAGGNVTVPAADGTNPRFDLVLADNNGNLVTPIAVGDGKGTASANPVFPSVPANRVVLAAIYVPANDTAIESGQIVDKGVLVQSIPAGAMWRSTSQAISGNTVIDFDTSVYDTGGVVDLVNNKLVAPTSGLYLIIGEAFWSRSSGGAVYLELKINGTVVSAAEHEQTGFTLRKVHAIRRMAANDSVQLSVTGGDSVQPYGTAGLNLSMVRVGDY